MDYTEISLCSVASLEFSRISYMLFIFEYLKQIRNILYKNLKWTQDFGKKLYLTSLYKDYIHVMKKLQCLLKKNIHGSHLSLTSMFSTRSNFSLSFCICSNASIISLLHCSTLSTPQSILQPFCSLVLRTTLSIPIFLFGVTFNPKLSFQFPY